DAHAVDAGDERLVLNELVPPVACDDAGGHQHVGRVVQLDLRVERVDELPGPVGRGAGLQPEAVGRTRDIDRVPVRVGGGPDLHVIDVPSLEIVGDAVNRVEQKADLDVLAGERGEAGRGRAPGAAQRQTAAAGAGEDGAERGEVVVAHLHAGDVETAVTFRLK